MTKRTVIAAGKRAAAAPFLPRPAVSEAPRSPFLPHLPASQGKAGGQVDAAGLMTAGAAHSWSGFLILKGDEGLEAAVTSAVAATGRTVRGLVVQVGGVFTPPCQRGQGYARAAVAASLQLKREQGFRRSVLFTAEANHAARRAYTALGYEIVGDYGLVLF